MWINDGQVVEAGNPGDVISHYLPKNQATNLESFWEDEQTAPGNESVRLRSVRLMLQQDSGGLITVHTPLQIEFTYWNYVPDSVLNISMLLYDLEEACVFNAVSDFAPRPVGLIRHTLEIPGDFLNSGSYHINVLIVKDTSVAILKRDNVIAFEVLEGDAIGSFYGRLPGAVRPKLKWDSEAIEAESLSASTARDRSPLA